MAHEVAKVAKTSLLACLQCPLCCNLIHMATTISECLHTFCKDCIYQRLDDCETDCCPVCNVSLGCSPLEKLRADHQFDDMCSKIFPSKTKKSNTMDKHSDATKKKGKPIDSRPSDVPPTTRRKERSLSSLGVGISIPMDHPGFVSRRTKSWSRRSVIARNTSRDPGHLDFQRVEAKRENLSSLPEVKEEFANGELGNLPEVAAPVSNPPPNVATNGTVLSSELGLHFTKTLKVNPIAGMLHNGHSEESPCERIEGTLNNKADTSFLQPQKETMVEASKKCFKTSNTVQSIEKVKQKKELVLKTDITSPVDKGDTVGPISQLQPHLSRASVGPKKLPLAKNTGLAKGSSPSQKETGFWIALQASENQSIENALPQISTRYLRLNDGKMPVSIVKKYLAKKLDLKNESEVEIECCGQPVVSNVAALDSLQRIWFMKVSPSNQNDLSSKDMDHNSSTNAKSSSIPLPGTSAENYVMVLHYRRYRPF